MIQSSDFSKRLKELREERNLSLRQLAEDTGYSHNSIGRWQKRIQVPNADVIIKLANYFGVTVGYLVGTED